MDVNDNILRDALLDAAADEFADILENDAPPVIFSSRYQTKRIRFLNSPSKYAAPKNVKWKRTLARAAVFALVFLILFGSSRLSMTASAQNSQRMSKNVKDNLIYSCEKDYSPTADAGDWYLEYLPAGYEEAAREDTGDFCSTHYVNGTKLIDFIYFHTSAYMNIKLNTGSYHLETAVVNGTAAVFHRAENVGLNNMLMWFSEDGKLVFILDAPLSCTELVRIAESVTLE